MTRPPMPYPGAGWTHGRVKTGGFLLLLLVALAGTSARVGSGSSDPEIAIAFTGLASLIVAAAWVVGWQHMKAVGRYRYARSMGRTPPSSGVGRAPGRLVMAAFGVSLLLVAALASPAAAASLGFYGLIGGIQIGMIVIVLGGMWSGRTI